MAANVSYRDFLYPLNVLMHVLTLEEGTADALHYGLFTSPDEAIGVAQARSTALLMARLPPPPARLLDVGIGLGATLHELTSRGYDAHGITPEPAQIAMARDRYHDALPVTCQRFEELCPATPRFDVVLFQESSQYIDASRLFPVARAITSRLLVIDEFALRPETGPGTLQTRAAFIAAASASGFALCAELDLSRQAAHTVDYFLERLPRRRRTVCHDLGVSDGQFDALLASGRRYRDCYATGAYGYRLMDLRCAP